MEYMCLIAVLVNCALIGLSGQVHRMFPDMTATQTILLIVALEHIMLCIRFLITCAIPELPSWLATEVAKLEWARREAGRLTATATPSPDPVDPATAQLIGRFQVSPSHTARSPAEINLQPPPLKTINVDSKSDKSKSGSEVSLEPSPPLTPPAPVIVPPTIKKFGVGDIPKIPAFKPRKSTDWVPPKDNEEHHLTIGPGGGAEWARRLKVEVNENLYRSTDCILPKDQVSISDSDLLRTNPLWPPVPRPVPVPSTGIIKPKVVEPNLSDSSKTLNSQDGEDRPLTKGMNSKIT